MLFQLHETLLSCIRVIKTSVSDAYYCFMIEIRWWLDWN